MKLQDGFYCSYFPPSKKKESTSVTAYLYTECQVFRQLFSRFEACDICLLHGKNFVFVRREVTRRETWKIFIFENIMQSSSASKQEFFWLSSRINRRRRYVKEEDEAILWGAIKKDSSSVLGAERIWVKAGTFSRWSAYIAVANAM